MRCKLQYKWQTAKGGIFIPGILPISLAKLIKFSKAKWMNANLITAPTKLRYNIS